MTTLLAEGARVMPQVPPGPNRALIEVTELRKHFAARSGMLGGTTGLVRAVDDISFDLIEGETLGVVGESGCGKSTTARLLMHLIQPDRGTIRFEGAAIGPRGMPLRAYRKRVQMVFQDSFASLNPRLTIEDSIAFGPIVHGQRRRQALALAHDLMMRVGLEPQRFAGRYPHELSGGQRQRVNIARAIALEPRVLILDEAVSALDKSVEAQVLNLLLDLKQAFGLTYIFISHDLDVIRFMADRVMVMYLGRIAEIGPSRALFAQPAHPYTTALLASRLSLDPDRRTTKPPLAGDPPNPINPPSGCRFHPRCAFAQAQCAAKEPHLRSITRADPPTDGQPHTVACHMAHDPTWPASHVS